MARDDPLSELRIDDFRQLPAELETARATAPGQWVNHTRRALAAAQFLAQLTTVGSATQATSELLTRAWLDDEGLGPVVTEIREYVQALYDGPLKTAQERLETARRRIRRGESNEVWSEDLRKAVDAAHQYRGAAESRDAEHEIAYADLLLSEIHALQGDQAEAVERAESAHRRASQLLQRSVASIERATAEGHVAAYRRSIRQFRSHASAYELVLESAGVFLQQLGRQPDLVLTSTTAAGVLKPSKLPAAWRATRHGISAATRFVKRRRT